MENVLQELVIWEREPAHIGQSKTGQRQKVQGVVIGKLISAKKADCILVDYPDNSFGPLPARSTISIGVEDKNKNVVLSFEKNDPRLPIIIGLVRTQPVVVTQEIPLNRKEISDIIVDGEKFIVNARDRVEIHCGESSLIMNEDGTVVIRGIQLVSRASRINKIKGAAVRIN